jgi:carbon-monoxide dehydrogenase large subunit
MGGGRFVDDITMPGMIYCAFVRSVYPHASLRSVDADGFVLTWKTLEKICRPYMVKIPIPGVKPYTLYYLAHRKVRYVGEPVAMVLAGDRYRVSDLVETVNVDYEPLPPVPDVESALSPDAAVINEEWGDNIAAKLHLRVGDIESSLGRSPKIMEQSFSIGRATPAPLEPRAILASYDKVSGLLTVYISNQAPHVERALLSEALGLPENRVRVVTPDVGGAFGQKCLLYPEDVAVCLASMLTGRPVKWVETRRENLISSSHAREQRHHVRVGFNRDGVITALYDEIVTDIGAGILYPHSSIGTSIVTASMLPGPYRFRNYEAWITCVASNKCPFGAYRGFGQPEATFVMERVVEMIADELGLDPVEVRTANMVKDEEIPFTSVSGTLIESGSPAGTLAGLLTQAGYGMLKSLQQGHGRTSFTGVGIACNTETTIPTLAFQTGRWGGTEYATVSITPEGGVVVRTGAVNMGTGLSTTLAQIAAEELGQPIDRVVVLAGDTDSTPFSTGLWGSRGCAMVGTAVQTACRKLVEKICKIAAHLLEANVGDIVLDGEMVYVRGHSDRSITLREVARIAYNDPHRLPADLDPGLEATASFEAPNISRQPDAEGRLNVSGGTTNAAHLALVELDIETGGIRLLAYHVFHDSGLSLNPAIVDGQVVGGLAQSIGSTIYEELVYVDGNPVTTTFMDYLIPGPAEIPGIKTYSSEKPSPYIPLGVKGVGESGTIAAPAAIINAVENALRKAGFKTRLTSTPIHPHSLWNLMKLR